MTYDPALDTDDEPVPSPATDAAADAKSKRRRPPTARKPRVVTMREGRLLRDEPSDVRNRAELETHLGRRKAMQYRLVSIGADRYHLHATDRGEVFAWLERAQNGKTVAIPCPVRTKAAAR